MTTTEFISNEMLTTILATLDADSAQGITEHLHHVAALYQNDGNLVQEVWKAKCVEKFDLQVLPNATVDWRLVYMILDKRGIEESLEVVHEMQAPEVLDIILVNTHLPVKFLPSINNALRYDSLKTLVKLTGDPRAVDEMEEAKSLPVEVRWYPATEAVLNHDSIPVLDYLITSSIATPEDLALALHVATENDRVNVFKRLIKPGTSVNLIESDVLVQAASNLCWKILDYLKSVRHQISSESVVKASIAAPHEDVKNYLLQNFVN